MKSTGWCIALLACCLVLQGPTVSGAEPEQVPIYRVTLVARTTQAINYSQLRGATRVDLRGTPLLARAEGEALIRNRTGAMQIDAKFDELTPATQFGKEYLTYVLWAITPEGRATNLGEVLLDGDESRLRTTTELRVFALIMTAEPHFAVTLPSDVVVIENFVRPDTVGKIQLVNAKYELLERGHYTLQVGQAAPPDSKTPLELREARLALNLAQSAGADRYAKDTFQRASRLLADAEKERSWRRASRIAREAVQTAEDARLIAVKRGDEESLAQERKASAESEARSRAQATEEARLRAQAEADRASERDRRAQAELERERSEQATAEAERARAEAERFRTQALSEAERAERERQGAEAARQAAEVEAARARTMAEDAERLRSESEQDRAALRTRLQEQLNRVLETRETARGLVVNMSDVLFASGQHALQAGTREKLAKIAGIVLSHPGLALEVEGHTDSVGGDEFNQRLSEQRASGVREYLVQQGVPGTAIAARGFGESRPVTSNDTPADRQQNRRVEIVVSGEPIGIVLDPMDSAAVPR